MTGLREAQREKDAERREHLIGESGFAAKRRPALSPGEAIANAVKLLKGDPAAAERQAREVAKVLPQDARALLIIGVARRRLGDFAAAKLILSQIAAAKPQSAEAYYELGVALAMSGERDGAIVALRRAADLESDFAQAWLLLSEQLYLAGDKAAATEVYDELVRVAVKDPNLRAALAWLREGRLADAEAKLRIYLRANPGDLGAARLLAETLGRRNRREEAEVILAHCLRVAPSFAAARYTYALTLCQQNKAEEAVVELETLIAAHPDNPRFLSALAACRVLRMDYEAAIPMLADFSSPAIPTTRASGSTTARACASSAAATKPSRPTVARSPCNRAPGRPTGASPTSRSGRSMRPTSPR